MYGANPTSDVTLPTAMRVAAAGFRHSGDRP